MHVSERRACAALGQRRSTQRKVPRGREDEERLTADTIALARQYGRYGYRKIAGPSDMRAFLLTPAPTFRHQSQSSTAPMDRILSAARRRDPQAGLPVANRPLSPKSTYLGSHEFSRNIAWAEV